MFSELVASAATPRGLLQPQGIESFQLQVTFTHHQPLAQRGSWAQAQKAVEAES